MTVICCIMVSTIDTAVTRTCCPALRVSFLAGKAAALEVRICHGPVARRTLRCRGFRVEGLGSRLSHAPALWRIPLGAAKLGMRLM